MSVYSKFSASRRTELEQKQKRLAGGVGKLSDSKKLVDQLKESAASKSKELAQMQQKADQALHQITNEMTVFHLI